MSPVKIVDKTQAQLIAERRADRAEMLAAVAESTMRARWQLGKLTELIEGGRRMTNERIATLFSAVLCALDDQHVNLSDLITEEEAVVLDRKLNRIESDGLDSDRQVDELKAVIIELKAELLMMNLSEGEAE